MLAAIRAYFAAQDVLEVETPLLCQGIGTDPHLEFLPVPQASGEPRYLQTSPEFAMKRLLAAGSGSIYQICKAFRGHESGRLHNPEFTILEWYRVGCDLDGLMDDMEALLGRIAEGRLNAATTRRVAYREVFLEYAGVEPLDGTFEELAACAVRHGVPEAAELCGEDRSLWLDLLFSVAVQPQLGRDGLCFVYDYPACQPSLARAKPGDGRWVERVELFWRGVELANGFHELADAAEQAARFEAERQARREQRLPVPEADGRLLAALTHGLPDCSGVAIGLDRLLMLLADAGHIDEVLAFPHTRA
ncbi:elongation factor P--(R)-beta-lysine ligase [Methylogaea oryzae]|uniref:Elongation factor P--(R)-beta-lysine ligase n=2 Tax=Methylogaea oryzae TaxID=1295382 RepID=A0A8D5AK32_9GAMM|nr:elongation factor P--(R)-beta-lysine ligase [Methylogaea oryzae]